MGWVLLVTIVAAWLILATRWLVRDPHDDQAAVQSHQRALDRLRHVEGDPDSPPPEEASPPQAHVRVLSSRERRPGRPPRPAPSTVPAPPFAVDLDESVDERLTTADSPTTSDEETGGPASPEDLRSLASAWPYRRRLGAPRWLRVALACTLVGAVVVAGAIAAGWGRSGSGSGATAERAPEAETPRSTPSSDASDSEAPATPDVRLVASDGETASYAVSADLATVTVVAHEPCWVQVRSADGGGAVLFEATVAPGEQHTFEDPAGVWLRLGNPGGVEVQSNGSPVELPPEGRGGSPFNVELRIAPDDPSDAAVSADAAG